MGKELAVPERIELMDKIAKLWLTGNRNPTQIAKELSTTLGRNIKRAEVLEYIEDYKKIAHNDDEIKNRAKEALMEADEALNLVVKELWDIVNTADDQKVATTALKNIADIDIKRVETLQKAGLYDDAAMGDELAAMEEKQAILVGILKEVSLNCEHCKYEVARRLKRVTGQPEPINPDPKVIDVEVSVPNAE